MENMYTENIIEHRAISGDHALLTTATRPGPERSGADSSQTHTPPERSHSISHASGEPQTSDTTGAGRAARDTQNASPPHTRHARHARHADIRSDHTYTYIHTRHGYTPAAIPEHPQ